jgi:Family of unknown function (DUF6521)
MNLPWNRRAVEEANLFNPAFGAVLLGTTAKEFVKKTGKPLPFPLAFLVLPIALHGQTRTELPHSTLTGLLPWLQEHRVALVGFAERVTGLRVMTQEALLFGLGQGVLALTEAHISATKKFRAATPERADLFTKEAFDCVDAAAFLGRWFAAAGTTSTIYAAWGVAP